MTQAATPSRAAPYRTSTRPASAPTDYFQQMLASTARAMGTTFKATYRATDGTTLVYAQIAQLSAYATGATSYYSNGTTNTICDRSNGRWACSPNAKRLTGPVSLVSPVNAWDAIRAASTARTSITHSTQAGRVQCLAYTLAGQATKYCVNAFGVVVYVSIPQGSFHLTGYTSSVTRSQVTAPAG